MTFLSVHSPKTMIDTVKMFLRFRRRADMPSHVEVVVERTLSWLMRHGRLESDYETTPPAPNPSPIWP